MPCSGLARGLVAGGAGRLSGAGVSGAEPLALGAKPSASHGWVLIAERKVFLGETSWLEAHVHIAWARWGAQNTVVCEREPGLR